MAIIIYSNAVLEELKPSNLVFTEEEILNIFDDQYHTMCSKRLSEIPNSWAVWALMDNPPANEYNMIGSDVIDLDIDSPLVVIHDSEINPTWKLTDDILQKNYDEFLHDVSQYINEIAVEAVKEDQEKVNNGEKNSSLIVLKQMGVTPDKKLLFVFDIDSQTKDFFRDNSFAIFSQKILEYLESNFDKNLKNKVPFTIFDDNKTLVIVDDEKVEPTIDKLIEIFEYTEKYESCKVLSEMKVKWIKKAEPVEKKKRGRPKKQ